MNKIIASHDHNIAEYKVKIKNDRKEHQTDYSETVFELELKNSYMKVKLDNYTMEGKDKWETFKGLFIRDMEKLNIEFTDFSTTI
jgi:ABC-type Fe3+-citrate transport system substrate-binding protein